MAKVSKKFEKLTPFGGNYFTNRAFSSLSLDKVINETLGKRSSTYNGYQWDEIVTSMLDVYLSGGNCVEGVCRTEYITRSYGDKRYDHHPSSPHSHEHLSGDQPNEGSGKPYTIVR